MRKQLKAFSIIASALFAAGMAGNVHAYTYDNGFVSAQHRSADGTLTQVFADGSVLQTSKSGYMRSFPAGTAHVHALTSVYTPSATSSRDIAEKNSDGSVQLIDPATDEAFLLPSSVGTM